MTKVDFSLARTVLIHVIFQRPSVQRPSMARQEQEQEQEKRQNTKRCKRMEPPANETMTTAKPTTTTTAAAFTATKMLAKRVKKYLIFQSGTEVTESTFGSEKQLAEAMGKAYHSRVDTINFNSDSMKAVFGPPPPGFVEEAAMEVLRTGAVGTTLYPLFKNLKSEFRNRWTPFIEFRSGETEDDMLRRVINTVWAERKNLDNRKKGRPQDALPENCPPTFVPLEKETFMAFREHHTLQKEPSSLEKDDDEQIGLLGKRPMTRAEQRNKKKMKKIDTSSGITDKDVQKGLELASKNKEILALQTDIQLAMAFKGVDNDYFMELMESVKQRRKKMAEEEDKNNNSNSSNNNSSDSDN